MRLSAAALAFLGAAMIACIVLAIVNAIIGEWVNVAGAVFLFVLLVFFCRLATRPGPRDPR